MKKLILFVATAVAFSFATNLRADKVDALIKSEMEKCQIPGLAVTIIKKDKTIKTAAYGYSNLELKTRATPETVFEIGSVTKQFTAGCIMLLVQDGKLSLDDKIRKHLKNTPEIWSEITVRQLLTHTSGIKSYTGLDGFELTKRLKQDAFIKLIGAQPLEFQPGEKWKYCNTGFNLLGFIIENLSGQDYWTFIGQRIFTPLGMSVTTNREPSILVPNRADGYEFKGKTVINRDYDLTDIFAAGAIVSTVGDLAKWNAALNTDKLLTETSKIAMWTSGKLNSGKEHGYGFGWHVLPLKGHKNIGHSGSTSGFSASLQRFPDDNLSIIVLCNSGADGVATVLAKAIAELYFPKQETK